MYGTVAKVRVQPTKLTALHHLAADPTVRATVVLTDGDVHVPDARWPFELLWLLPPGASPTFAPPAGQVLRMTDGATTT